MRRFTTFTWRLARPSFRVLPTAVLLTACTQLSYTFAQSANDTKSLSDRPNPASVPASPPASHLGLTQLTPQSADALLADCSKDVFLMVYTDWCAKCAGLKIIYAQVATALAEVGAPVVVAMVDGANYVPPGFTMEQKTMFPRLKMFPANRADYGEQNAENFYMEPGLGADTIIRFIHARCGSFDLEQALSASERLQNSTMTQLQDHIMEMIAHDEQSSLQFKLMALGPCAQPVREAFLAWRLSQYFPEQELASHDKHMGIVQRCMISKENMDYWDHVSHIALDQLRVADKAQKKNEAEKKR